MSAKPTVSVVIPCFNARPYLAASIRSILTQTYQDFELLICDDGSTDGSDEIMRRFFHADRRIRLLNTDRLGPAAALNLMFQEARGEFVARQDADDIALPRRLSAELNVLRNNPAHVAVGAWFYVIDSAGRRVLHYAPPTDNNTLQAMILKGHALLQMGAALLRLDAVRRLGGIRTHFTIGEDLDLLLRLGEIGKMAILPQFLECQRHHPNSLGHTASSAKREADLQQALGEAMQRRNIPGQPPPPPTFFSLEDPHERFMKYAWWAFNHGDRATAMLYGWRAAKEKPLDPQAWKVMACTTLKWTG